MPESLLQLEGYHFRKASFAATRKRPVGKIVCEMVLSVGCTRHKEDRDRFQITVDVKFGPSTETEIEAGYTGEVEAVGRFRVDESLADGRKIDLVKVQGALLLMGAIRELIATMTSRGPWPKFVLPMVAFDHLLDTKAAGGVAKENRSLSQKEPLPAEDVGFDT